MESRVSLSSLDTTMIAPGPSPAQIRSAYGAAAEEYAARFCGELAHKPLDRALLRRFARVVAYCAIVHCVKFQSQRAGVLKSRESRRGVDA
jgi:hypothetical protein